VLVAIAALVRGDLADVVWVLAQSALGWAIAVYLRPKRAFLSGLLAATLMVFALTSVVERLGSAWTWHVSDEDAGVWAVLGRWAGHDPRIEEQDLVVRQWRARHEVTDASLRISGRLVAGE